MAALLIVNYDIDDPEGMAAYRAEAGPILRGRYGAQGVVNTSETIDLGEGGGVGATTVVFRFESMDVAHQAWESDAYQAVLPMRLAATTPRSAMLVETLPDA